MKNILCLIGLIIFFGACEEKMVVIPVFDPIQSGRVILVEELTGVRCPNCPAGSERLSSIATLYPDNIVIVGVHGTDLTKPLDESKYDFRNQDAIDLENFLKPYLGKPAAYFNRVFFDELEGDWGNSFNGQWQGYFERELEKPQVLELSITKSYDPETRALDITVGALALEDLSGEFKVTIMLTESEIVDAQDDQNTIIEEYTHKHVLREIITNYDGDQFASILEQGKPVSKQYTYTVPEDDTGLWNDDHIEVVAFIANTEGESEEVLQAGQTHLKD
ncbi:MAG: Omp28-related outer membrane protein [Saprospiraceae bacterium]|nr:Omp28-related outer membrane protein [Saprospiraceae bacterium]